MSLDPEATELITGVLEDSVRVFAAAPDAVRDFHGWQEWARRRKSFTRDGGVRATSADISDAGRQRSSRLRRRLEAEGLIRITRFGRTSQFVALTAAGLDLAEQLTGSTAPADLRAVTESMKPSPPSFRAPGGDLGGDTGAGGLVFEPVRPASALSLSSTTPVPHVAAGNPVPLESSHV